MEMWYLLAPPTGTHDIHVDLQGPDGTWSTGEPYTNSTMAGATSWFGVNQTNPLGTFVSNSGHNVTTASVNVISAGGEVALDTLSVNGGSAPSAGSGQDQHWSRQTGAGSSKVGASSVNMSWTIDLIYNGSPWVIGAVSLKPASEPPLPPSPSNGGQKPPSSGGGKTPGGGSTSGTLDSLQLEISVPYLIGRLKAKIEVGGVSKEIELLGNSKGYTLDLKGSNLSLNKEYNLVVTSDKTLVKKVKFTPTAGTTNLKVGDLVLGDLNQDDTIDSTDQLKLFDSITSQTPAGDVNVDQSTNSFDWVVMLFNFGKKGD